MRPIAQHVLVAIVYLPRVRYRPRHWTLHTMRAELGSTDIQRHIVDARGLVSGFGCKTFLLRRRRGVRTLALGPTINKAAGAIGALGHAALRHDKAVLELFLHREI